MPLSWNEIKQRAIQFSKEWKNEQREEAEAKSFWDEFFNVFGVRRRTVATFEEPVKNIKGQFGYIDLFWRGKLLVEHKSLGKDLGRAGSQAFQYIQNLASSGRQDEIPRYVIVSDFARIALYDLEPEGGTDIPVCPSPSTANAQAQTSAPPPQAQTEMSVPPSNCNAIEFPLSELHRHIHAFAFIPGYKQHRVDPEDPANIRAAEIMGELHDAIKAGGYSGHDLERFLVRILFCLFAEDTGIFEPNAFSQYIEDHTRDDGSDLGPQLAHIFDILNTAEDRRQKNIPAELAAFPYVNGGLFAERLPSVALNRDMRNALVACGRFNWSRISPAVFGSLFQSVMEDKARRQIGAHYTSERDILKVVRSLFLDDLRAEFDKIKTSRPKLEAFHKKLAALRFLDPACGCGNFLVVTYRELRLLEMDVLELLHHTGQGVTDIHLFCQVDVDQFYGIEIEEFPALIAETALWLMDHQMNVRLSERMGQYFQRLPLKKSATIRVGNALRTDWKSVLPPETCSYILGNPPFVGKQYQTAEQKADMKLVCGKVKGGGVLDYVTGWYFKAADYLTQGGTGCANSTHGGTDIPVCANSSQKPAQTGMSVPPYKAPVGFVSTNSISQGEQTGVLWSALFARGVKIHFAHRTFPWASEARGKAHVHVVIIGFGCADSAIKRIYEYDGETPTVSEVRNISPYLVEGSDFAILARTNAICNVPEIVFGSMPNDGGNLLLDNQQKEDLLKVEPQAAKWIRPFLGAQEFINGETRWCLWLEGIPPSELRNMPEVLKRVEAVRAARAISSRETTRELAATPTLFGEIRQPASEYLAIPSISSERRKYIPMGFLPPSVIGNNKLLFIPGATLYHFGILTSAMHMAWMRLVTGRLESRFQYSNKLVYNNFPWPDADEKRRDAIEQCAQAVLDARAKYPTSTLADLYDPLTMPPELVKAHNDLDRAVDRAYRPAAFPNDRARVEFLFTLYTHLTAPLEAGMAEKHTRKQKRQSPSQ